MFYNGLSNHSSAAGLSRVATIFSTTCAPIHVIGAKLEYLGLSASSLQQFIGEEKKKT